MYRDSQSFAICHLPFVLCHLPFVLCHLPFAICHLPSVIFLGGHSALPYIPDFPYFNVIYNIRIAKTAL